MPAAEYRDIVRDFHVLFESDVAAKQVASPAISPCSSTYDASAESGHIARHMSAHTHAAAKTRHIADFFARPNVMSWPNWVRSGSRQHMQRQKARCEEQIQKHVKGLFSLLRTGRMPGSQ